MKKFTKLALAASVAMSANAMAMQAMDDSALSSTTGQDGLTIGIGISKIAIEKLYIHDTTGLAADASIKSTGLVMDGADPEYTSGTLATKQIAGGPDIRDLTQTIAGNAGSRVNVNINTQTATYDNTLKDVNLGGNDEAAAIVIYGNGIDGDINENHGIVIGANYNDNGQYLLASRNLADLTIDSDGGDGNPFINIGAKVSGLDINIGKIGVAASGKQNEGANVGTIRRGHTGEINAILSGLSIKTGQMEANIQLGAAPQGAMIRLNSTMKGGLEILNLGILDNSTAMGDADASSAANRAAGEIFIDSIKLTDASSSDLVLNQQISVFGDDGTSKGHVRILSTSGAHDTYIKGIHLGSKTAASIGDVEIQGMQTYYSPSLGVYHPGAVITISGH
ncbi:pilus assembly protein FilA [Acinetobacter sp. NCu2D-2]|uniref:putative pilus system protein FilA n=1 Tax=Acinetobacter sp. NCu2D-2 TaxID=1608473 RepID=UPI0007CDC3E9|nr:DUF6160 family protein [Acinetobacter sp. NCu2D-2]ANF81131.1 pilus assembly protein FilA [Acinetobacter sp. NCu2D-2]